MAVMCGCSLVEQFDVTADDVCYLSMPLFHSNGVAGGWAVAIGSGAAMVPANSPRRGSSTTSAATASTYLNYVGKPLALVLATPEQPDDADNTLRIAFGNEATDRDIDEFARRFGCRVVDGFGSSEFAVIVVREDGTPPGSIGKGYRRRRGLPPRHRDRMRASRYSTRHGALTNFDEAVGELVNTTGRRPVRRLLQRSRLPPPSGCATACTGPATSPTATPTAGSISPDAPPTGCGSTARTWPPHRSSASCSGLPQLNQVAVYAVPDDAVGDQVMAAIVLNDGAELTPAELESFLADQADLSPKAWPRFVRVNEELPQTATNKILKRELIKAGATADGGMLWERPGRQRSYGIVEPGSTTTTGVVDLPVFDAVDHA